MGVHIDSSGHDIHTCRVDHHGSVFIRFSGQNHGTVPDPDILEFTVYAVCGIVYTPADYP